MLPSTWINGELQGCIDNNDINQTKLYKSICRYRALGYTVLPGSIDEELVCFLKSLFSTYQNLNNI